MVGERTGCDVVRLYKGSVKQVAERERVPRLKTDLVLFDTDKSLRGNACDLVEISAFFLGPIQDHARGRNLCKTADLTLVTGALLAEHVASL